MAESLAGVTLKAATRKFPQGNTSTHHKFGLVEIPKTEASNTGVIIAKPLLGQTKRIK
jgi:hypothetical protein